MTVVINGFELSDNEPYWWGWTMTAKGAHGHVDPDSRADFFAELATAQAASGELTFLMGADQGSVTRGGRWLYDTATGAVIQAAGGGTWIYGGTGTSMAVELCCFTDGRISLPPEVVASDGTADGPSGANHQVQFGLTVPAAGQGIVVALMSTQSVTSVRWRYQTGPDLYEDLTQLDALTGGPVGAVTTTLYQLWHLANPTPATGTLICEYTGDNRTQEFFALVDTATAPTVAQHLGSGVPPSRATSASGSSLVLDHLITWAPPDGLGFANYTSAQDFTPDAGQTELYEDTRTGSGPDHHGVASSAVGAATMGWTLGPLTSTTEYCHQIIVFPAS